MEASLSRRFVAASALIGALVATAVAGGQWAVLAGSRGKSNPAGKHEAVAEGDHAPLADHHAATAGHGHAISPEQALTTLLDGNRRFATDMPRHPNANAARRSDIASGQQPYAAILTCADSRVPPEMIFDAGLGDLFVTRVAGNLADDTVLGSLEYAVEHLGTPLVVVMGHERCGAVQAALQAAKSKEVPPGHLPALIDPIKTAIPAAAAEGDLLDRTIDNNVRNMVTRIQSSGPIAAFNRAGRVTVVGGRYDLDTGEFRLLYMDLASDQ